MSVPADGDALSGLRRQASDAAAQADAGTLERAGDCLLVALTEAAVSARSPAHRRAAAALAAEPGCATVAGLERGATVTGAVAANGLLVHAGLADDAYAVAVHPGAVVVPAALAGAQLQDASGAHVLDALVVGYETACRLADVLLPSAAERGWRASALVAPVAAAAVSARLRALDDDAATSALRIAAGVTGAALETVAGRGDDWRVQPGLAAAVGVLAARAAAGGMRGAVGSLDGRQGLYALACGAAWPGWPGAGAPRLHDVTFKRWGVAMYGQAIFDALERMPRLTGELARLSVTVHPFAVGYGEQSRRGTGSPASLRGIALQALATVQPAVTRATEEHVTVAADDALSPLGARVELEVAGAGIDAATAVGDGDTSGWRRADIVTRCAARSGRPEAVDRLAAAVAALGEQGLEELLAAWRSLAGEP